MKTEDKENKKNCQHTKNAEQRKEVLVNREKSANAYLLKLDEARLQIAS